MTVLSGAVRLRYFAGCGDSGNLVRYTVPLTRTPCNFGGFRPWFVCPGVVGEVPCDRRAAKLYLKGRYFLYRHCHDLVYASQRESFRTAPIDRAHRIRRRLGASANTTQPFPPTATVKSVDPDTIMDRASRGSPSTVEPAYRFYRYEQRCIYLRSECWPVPTVLSPLAAALHPPAALGLPISAGLR